MTVHRVDRRAIEELLSTLLVEVGGVAREKVHANSTIETDLQMESVAFLEVQVALEDELGIEIDPVRIVELNELGAIAEYIASLTTGHE
jgi:acyl carrier protein